MSFGTDVTAILDDLLALDDAVTVRLGSDVTTGVIEIEEIRTLDGTGAIQVQDRETVVLIRAGTLPAVVQGSVIRINDVNHNVRRVETVSPDARVTRLVIVPSTP